MSGSKTSTQAPSESISCQDISLAGRGEGLAGERSGLWREFARVVRELGPRWVVVENVAALRRRGLDAVLRDLAACGFDAQWDCIPAHAVGAPHRRDRIFVVAWRAAADGHDVVLDFRAALADTDLERLEGGAEVRTAGALAAASRRGGAALADTHSGRREGERGEARRAWGTCHLESESEHESNGCDLPEWPPASDDVHAWGLVPSYAQPAFCRVAHGVPRWMGDARRALGNAVVPAVGAVIGRAIAAASVETWIAEREANGTR